jgi:hypothetical protein
MKRIVQILLALVVTFSLLIGVFQLSRDVWTNVGWNGGVSASAPQSEQFAACTRCVVPDPFDTPNVGWNSGV